MKWAQGATVRSSFGASQVAWRNVIHHVNMAEWLQSKYFCKYNNRGNGKLKEIDVTRIDKQRDRQSGDGSIAYRSRQQVYWNLKFMKLAINLSCTYKNKK